MLPPQGPDPGPEFDFPIPPDSNPAEPSPGGASFSSPGIYIPPESEQAEIVAICNKFKIAALSHAKGKKEQMQRCYAYVKSQFYDDSDLLPRPASEGSDHDNNPERPQVFMPKARQRFKSLYSYLKLTLFPNDEDYFRVRSKTDAPIGGPQLVPGPNGMPVVMPSPTFADFEDDLTEGLKYIFREADIVKKLGDFLKDLVWSGNGCAYPTFSQNVTWQWSVGLTGFEPSMVMDPPKLDLHVWNPIHFYLDPKAFDKDKAGWGYFSVVRKDELMDSGNGQHYFNLDRIAEMNSTSILESQPMEGITLSQYNDINNVFYTDDNLLYTDYYYFPYLKTGGFSSITGEGREYRNMLVTVANGQTMIEFRPNLMPKGLPPVVHGTWMDDKDSPYGTGPIEDISDLQRHVNLVSNYLIETLARIGNRFVVSKDVNLDNFWGIAGGIGVTENPERDVKAITGDYIEIEHLMNYIGTITAEIDLLAGSQDPFQGASNIDFKKTATEIQVLQENSISVIREVVEHVSRYIEQILERFMLLVPELYKDPLTIRVDDPMQGTQYKTIDFSLLNSGNYTIELIGANPSQSKQAQVQAITELITGFIQNPAMMGVFKPLIIQAMQFQGIKDGGEKIDEVLKNFGEMMQNAQAAQAQQQPIQGPQGGLPSNAPQPGGAQPMGGPP